MSIATKDDIINDIIERLLTQKNVIHTADSTAEALDNLRTILGGKFDYMQEIVNLPAELWDVFKE